jgi:hypothetical protein
MNRQILSSKVGAVGWFAQKFQNFSSARKAQGMESAAPPATGVDAPGVRRRVKPRNFGFLNYVAKNLKFADVFECRPVVQYRP